LVVEKTDGEGASLLSWTFVSVAAAMAVAHAFNDVVRWMVVKGTFHTARDAMKAAERRDAVVTRSSSESGTLAKVVADSEPLKQASSA